MKEFNQKGFPIIKLHDDHFEIKAIDSLEYTSFDYSEISKILYDKSGINSKWWFSIITQIFLSDITPFKLIITKRNRLEWTYKTNNTPQVEFESILKEL